MGKRKYSDIRVEARIGDRTRYYILKMLYQGEEKEKYIKEKYINVFYEAKITYETKWGITS